MENEFKFTPKQWVLVRADKECEWSIDLFSHYNKDGSPVTTGSCKWDFVIPYEGNEHLLGTTDDYVGQWQPKDGDFIAIEETFPNGDKAKWICVFNTFEEFKICFHIGLDSDFVLMRGGGEGWYYRDHTESFRSATEEERQLLLSQLHEAGKDWNAEKKKIVNYELQPREGEFYWFVDSDLTAQKEVWLGYNIDRRRQAAGNCFQTEAEAQVMANKSKELF